MISLSYKRLHSDNDLENGIFKCFNKNLYTNENGMGYHPIEQSDDYLIAYYIYTYPSSINVYNELKEDFESVTIQVQDHLPFCIDIKNALMICLCAKNKVARLIDVVSATLEYRYTIENVEINMDRLLTDFKKQNLNYEIKRIRINEMKNHSGDIYDVIYKTLSKQTEDEVFSNHKDKIYQYTICIDEDLSFNVLKTGSIRVIRSIDSISIKDMRTFVSALI